MVSSRSRGLSRYANNLLRPVFPHTNGQYTDHTGLRLAVQHPGLACLRWSCYHDRLYPPEHPHRPVLEEAAREANEEQGQAHATHVRLACEHPQVSSVRPRSYIRRVLTVTTSIKLYAWENAFIRWVSEVRNNQELRMLRKIGIVTVSNMRYLSRLPLTAGVVFEYFNVERHSM